MGIRGIQAPRARKNTGWGEPAIPTFAIAPGGLRTAAGGEAVELGQQLPPGFEFI